MARRLTESPVTTRASRSTLPPGLHWRLLDPDVHLGYRKGRRGGKWLVRFYIRERATYRRAELGTADDILREGTLSFDDAVKAARAAVTTARKRDAADSAGPVLTIRSAVEGYTAMRDARDGVREGREIRSDASIKLKKHVLDNAPLASIRLDELTESDLSGWRDGLPRHLKATSQRRIVNDLKAALNGAYRAHRKRLPRDLAETIRMGLSCSGLAPEEPSDLNESQILDDPVVRSLVAQALAIDEDQDFGRLVLGLAATGARFSQLKRMRVRDIQLGFERFLVPKSRKGRNRVAGYTPVRVGADVIDAMLPLLEGRGPDEPLFCRWRHKQIGPAKWERESRGPWKAPSEMIRPWKATCERAGVAGVTPYALRHSSIVRGIRAGLPIRLVAALHDTSIAMIERHYSRWIADGLEELAVRAIVPLAKIAA